MSSNTTYLGCLPQLRCHPGFDSHQKLDAKNLASVHWCQLESWIQSFGQVEKNSFVTLLGRGGGKLKVPALKTTKWKNDKKLTFHKNISLFSSKNCNV